MSDVDEVKARTNIVDVIGERVTLKKAGRHFKALCPFHSEKTPSFIVSPERAVWKCFGCNKGGSVIDFVMEYEHVDFVEALEALAEKAGIKLERRFTDTPQAKLKERIYQVNHVASEFYQYLLATHALGEKARFYLKNRGISDASIKTFALGYSPNSWDGLLKYLHKKGYDNPILEQAGLAIPSSRGGYDRFRGRVMFTLKDHRGNVVGFSGRVLDPEIKEAKYINTSETPVYSKSNLLYGFDVTKKAIGDANEAIITEGEFDVIALFQAGIPNVVAIKGSALTEGHVHLLCRFTERIIFALDSDMAGDAASRRGIEIADKAGLDMKVLTLPSGKDPDEAARQNPVLLKKAIKDAVPVYDYFIDSAIHRFDVTTAFGKRKISEEILPVLASIDNTIVQGHYTKKLASVLSVSEETITESIKRFLGRQRRIVPKTHVDDQEPSTMADKLERYVLALVLQGDTAQSFEELIEEVDLADIANSAVQLLLKKLSAHLSEHRIFLLKDFIDALPKELIPTVDDAFLWDTSESANDSERFAKEWAKTIRTLRQAILRRKIRETTDALNCADDAHDHTQELHTTLKIYTDALKAIEKSS